MKNNAAHCRDAVMNAFRKAYKAWWTKEPTTTCNLRTAANFSTWIKPHLNNFNKITDFQQFEIYKEGPDTVVRARGRCSSKTARWFGLGGPNDAYTRVLSTFNNFAYFF